MKKNSIVGLLLCVVVCLSGFVGFTIGQGAAPNFSDYYLDQSVAPYSYMICTDNNGWYWAVNGSNGAVCWTSTNASYVVNSAIQALPLSSIAIGGEIFIKTGVYSITNTIVIDRSVTLIGEGWTTILQLSSSANCDLVHIDTTTRIINLPAISYIYLDGNKTSNTLGNGIHVFGANILHDILIFNAHCFNFAENGILIEKGNAHRLISIDSENNGKDGIALISPNEDSIIDSCYTYSNGGLGLNVTSPNTSITNCRSYSNVLDGIYISGGLSRVTNSIFNLNGKNGIYHAGANINLLNNEVSFNNQSGIVAGGSSSYISNNRIYSNSLLTHWEYMGINVTGTYNKIFANHIESAVPVAHGYNLYVSAGATNQEIKDNEFVLGGASVNIGGNAIALTSCMINSNVGFVTENTFSGGNTTATTAVLNHGLTAAATGVWVSFNSSTITGYTWVSSATQVTITPTGTLPASWTCYVNVIYKP